MKHQLQESYWANTDAVCFVATSERKIDLVYKVLDAFLEAKEELNSDYCENPEDPLSGFANETEMIEFFVNRQNLRQSFFWNEKQKSKDMVGADFTVDGGIIFSVTTKANGEKEEGVLKKLKAVLGQTLGVIYYNEYPEFEGVEAFEKEFEERLNL